MSIFHSIITIAWKLLIYIKYVDQIKFLANGTVQVMVRLFELILILVQPKQLVHFNIELTFLVVLCLDFCFFLLKLIDSKCTKQDSFVTSLSLNEESHILRTHI